MRKKRMYVPLTNIAEPTLCTEKTNLSRASQPDRSARADPIRRLTFDTAELFTIPPRFGFRRR